jgi:serine/threonine protein kinase
MQDLAATLDDGGGEPVSASDPPQQRPRAGAMKFVYSSGSRPLEGYTIKRGIGIGGFGEVYFATSDAGKEVAIKRIQRNLDIEVRGVSQCLNLKHINLLSLFDIKYDDQGEGWVVMEYVSGESLTDVIDRNPNGMPEDELFHWFSGIASGVKYLHDHGIVHRDLKPGNIFIDHTTVKIGDYGLSKFISCSRTSGQTESVGTFHYMAPEIGNGVYGKEIDIYALGIILYEMLTGNVPFEGESSQEIIMKHLTADPDLDGIPAGYRETIRRSLLKDPDKRFSDVSELLACLGIVDVDGERLKTTAPPVRQEAPTQKTSQEEPIYISDDDEEDSDEIALGLVQEIPTARRVNMPHLPNAAQNRPVPQASIRRRPTLSNNDTLSQILKVMLLVIAVCVLIRFHLQIIPAVLIVGVLYLGYLGLKKLRAPKTASGESADMPHSVIAWRHQTRQYMQEKPPAEQLMEITGSMLTSALVAAVLFLGLTMVSGAFETYGNVATWSTYFWLTLTTVAASWTMLLMGKQWERSEGDPRMRRVALLAAGLGVGALSYVLAAGLYVPQAQLMTEPITGIEIPALYASLSSNQVIPEMGAFMAYFGGLFAVMRWWRQVDPVRASRVSIWSTCLVVLVALLVHTVFAFSQPWGLMIAAVTSISVQLSSQWIRPLENAKRVPAQEIV